MSLESTDLVTLHSDWLWQLAGLRDEDSDLARARLAAELEISPAELHQHLVPVLHHTAALHTFLFEKNNSQIENFDFDDF